MICEACNAVMGVSDVEVWRDRENIRTTFTAFHCPRCNKVKLIPKSRFTLKGSRAERSPSEAQRSAAYKPVKFSPEYPGRSPREGGRGGGS